MDSESTGSISKTAPDRANSSKEEEKKPKKMCCACPDTKKARDECIIENGEDGTFFRSFLSPDLALFHRS